MPLYDESARPCRTRQTVALWSPIIAIPSAGGAGAVMRPNRQRSASTVAEAPAPRWASAHSSPASAVQRRTARRFSLPSKRNREACGPKPQSLALTIAAPWIATAVCPPSLTSVSQPSAPIPFGAGRLTSLPPRKQQRSKRTSGAAPRDATTSTEL